MKLKGHCLTFSHSGKMKAYPRSKAEKEQAKSAHFRAGQIRNFQTVANAFLLPLASANAKQIQKQNQRQMQKQKQELLKKK